MPYMDELTVFIKVKIDNLKEFSKSMPLKVNKKAKRNKEIMNIIIQKIHHLYQDQLVKLYSRILSIIHKPSQQQLVYITIVMIY